MKCLQVKTINGRVYVYDLITDDTFGDFENLLDAVEAIRMHERIVATRNKDGAETATRIR